MAISRIVRQAAEHLSVILLPADVNTSKRRVSSGRVEMARFLLGVIFRVL